jgi:hypothetical protein
MELILQVKSCYPGLINCRVPPDKKWVVAWNRAQLHQHISISTQFQDFINKLPWNCSGSRLLRRYSSHRGSRFIQPPGTRIVKIILGTSTFRLLKGQNMSYSWGRCLRRDRGGSTPKAALYRISDASREDPLE